MYCLRTFLPLLLLPLPLSLSPLHLTTLLLITYLLNRPCVYCTLLLVILFASECAWRGGSSGVGCLWSAAPTGMPAGMGWRGWFVPRLYTTGVGHAGAQGEGQAQGMESFLLDLANSTISTLASSAVGAISNGSPAAAGVFAKAGGYIPGLQASIANSSTTAAVAVRDVSGGVGTQWLKTLLGRGEWMIPCVNVRVVI